MIPILIGASGSFNRSPTIPLTLGKHRISVAGVKDTELNISFGDATVALVDGFTITGPRDLYVSNAKCGTEKNTITVSAHLIKE